MVNILLGERERITSLLMALLDEGKDDSGLSGAIFGRTMEGIPKLILSLNLIKVQQTFRQPGVYWCHERQYLVPSIDRPSM